MSAEQNQPDQPDPLAIFKGGVAAGMPEAAPQICPYPSMTKEAAEWRRGKRWGIDMAKMERELDEHIPVPSVGFASNEAEAEWLEQTLVMRIKETLRSGGLPHVSIHPKGLYDLLLISLNGASRRGSQRGE